MKNETQTVKFDHVMEMVGFLKTNGTGCRFVSILTETTPKLKVSCPIKGVKKVARRIGWLNMNYNKAVRSKIAKILDVEIADVEYTNGETWYQHVMTAEGKALPLCVNKKTPDNGNFYVQYFPKTSTSMYVDGNGNEIAERELEPYFYAKSEASNFKPAVITISLENVKQLRASGLIIETVSDAELQELETLLLD